MKKMTDKVLTIAADLTLKAVAKASGKASMAGTYQPKEPKNIKNILERHAKKS